MSEEVKILCLYGEHGEFDDILTNQPVRKMFLNRYTIETERDGWYCRDTLVESEHWLPEWREQFADLIETCIAVCTEVGIEPPEWVNKERNSRLMGLLADIESL